MSAGPSAGRQSMDLSFLRAYEGELIFSGLLVATVLLLRVMAARALLRFETLSADVRRRWVAVVRNISIVVLLFGLLSIWAEQVQTVAVSMLAFAVAAVIATKELILCASGSFVRASGNAYGIGDRVEIGGSRGEVVDLSILTTTLLEMGPAPMHQFTGRTIVIPNSVLLSHPVVNESYDDKVDLHIIRVPLDEGEDWESAERGLLEAARIECGPFIEEARAHLRRVEAIRGVEAPSVDPRVTVQLPEPGQVTLLLRVATPARRKGRVEQAILRRYLRGRRAAQMDHERTTPEEAVPLHDPR